MKKLFALTIVLVLVLFAGCVGSTGGVDETTVTNDTEEMSETDTPADQTETDTPIEQIETDTPAGQTETDTSPETESEKNSSAANDTAADTDTSSDDASAEEEESQAETQQTNASTFADGFNESMSQYDTSIESAEFERGVFEVTYRTIATNQNESFRELLAVSLAYADEVNASEGWSPRRADMDVRDDEGRKIVTYQIDTDLARQYNSGEITINEYANTVTSTIERPWE